MKYSKQKLTINKFTFNSNTRININEKNNNGTYIESRGTPL